MKKIKMINNERGYAHQSGMFEREKIENRVDYYVFRKMTKNNYLFFSTNRSQTIKELKHFIEVSVQERENKNREVGILVNHLETEKQNLLEKL